VLVLVLALASALVAYLVWRLVQPFVAPITWALVLTVLAHPMHERIKQHVRWPSVAAGIAVLIVTLVIALPATFVVRQAADEAIASVTTVTKLISGERWKVLVDRFPRAASLRSWIEREVNVQDAVTKAGSEVARGVQGTLTRIVDTTMAAVVTLFMLFFFLRDKAWILRAVRRLLPLARAEAEQVRARVRDTITAIVFGSLVVAVVQGTLGGIIFWWLDLPSPLLWGVVMGLMAMLPMFGTALVWVPAAGFLAINGEWDKALILVAFGTAVIGVVDNLLYPVLVKGTLRLHTVPVFVSVLGGLLAFGATGIVLGPVLLGVGLALLDIWQRRMALGDIEEGVNEE
jgi:predicted PurR-regulated permease PerM